MRLTNPLRHCCMGILAILAAWLPPAALAAPVSFDWGSFSSLGLETYGVTDADTYASLMMGSLAQLIWTGPDGLIDPPQCEGQPSGDDRLLDTNTIQNGGSLPPPQWDKGYLPLKTYSFDTEDAKSGGGVYIRAWDAPAVHDANRYGDSVVRALTGGSTFNAPGWATDRAWPAPAAWTGPDGGSWHEGGYWSSGCVPNGRTTVAIPEGATVVLTNDGAARSLTIGNGSTLDLASHQLTVEDAVINNGTLRQSRTVDAACTVEAPCQLLFLRDQYGATTRHYGVDLIPVGGDRNLGQTTAEIMGNRTCGMTAWDATAARRCYRVSPSTQLATTVRFYISESELQPGQDPSNLQIWRLDGADWLPVAKTGHSGATCTGGECWVEGAPDVLGVFALNDISPTAVTMTELDAVQVNDAIVMQWETGNEANNLGFNLWRGISPTEPDIKLNQALIPGREPGSPAGSVYVWEDRHDLVDGTTYWYWLEDLDTEGRVTRHDPISVQYTVPNAVTLREVQAIPDGRRALAWLIAAALFALGAVVLRRRQPIR